MGNLISSLFGNNEVDDINIVPRRQNLNYHYNYQYTQPLEQRIPVVPVRTTFKERQQWDVGGVFLQEKSSDVIVTSIDKWKYVISDADVIRNFLKCSEYKYLLDTVFLYTSINSSSYHLLPCSSDSIEFSTINSLFVRTNKKCYRIQEIKQLVNPYLMMQYELMKEQYRRIYREVTEKILFHGTCRANLDSIFKYNFNWRLNRGHKFGQGVSFTPISNYATHYGDKTFRKVMIVAKVLVSSTCSGNNLMILPPTNYDTTTNENQHVFVKYEDNTFCPCYVIYYEGCERRA